MIVVNPATRQFNIPGADIVFGVTADANSAIKHFQCPRYVGNNVDIASSFVRINYQNPHGDIDFYLVKDVTVDGDNVMFSWELHPKVTMYKGNVSFVMCVTGPDMKVKWHTTLGRGQVLEGLEPDSTLVETETADGIAALIAMVDAQTVAVEKTGADQVTVVKAAAKTAQDSAVAEVEAKRKNSLDSIPDDYTSLGNAVDSLVRGRAGAIVCEVEGSAIAVKDASNMAIHSLRIFGRSTQDGIPTPEAPVEIKSVESPVVMVTGRNLCDPTAFSSMTEAGKSTNTYDPGSLTVKMMASPTTVAGRYCVPLHNLAIGQSYVVSFDLKGTAGRSVKCGWDRNPARITLTDSFVRYSSVVVATRKDEPIIFYSVATADGGLVTGEFLQFANVQIEPGTIANAYEPYKPVQTIVTTNTLRGIPVTSGGNYTDSNGQHWLCDEVDLERGVYVQRIGKKILAETDMTSVGSGYFEFGAYAYTTIRDALVTSSDVVVISDRLLGIRADRRSGFVYDNNYRCYAQDGIVYLRFPAGTGEKTLAECREAFTGATIQYVLATPIETTLSETEIAAYRSLHTNKPNTTILNDSSAHMKVEYAADTKLYIDNKLAPLVGNT